ncbi:MAG: extracellular solute-binding protein [Oscillospiraceae bacterium]|nr:extracellular solute-binding protein [Oscillospiraceae bacterium]
MKTFKKIMGCCLATAMLLGITACDEQGAVQSGAGTPAAVGTSGTVAAQTTTTNGANTTTDPNLNAATDEEIKDLDTSSYVPSGNAGVVKYLGYYDITVDQKGKEQIDIFESEKYGGKIEWISATFGDAYFEKLATLIAADDSPDLLTYELQAFPFGVSKNIYQPLDDLLDIDDPLWADMRDLIDSFEYKGQHYYFPHRIVTSYALNYNRKTIEDAGLKDPYDLYLNGEWTWDAWRQMMLDFCNQSPDHIGYYCTDSTVNSFVNTTGVVVVDLLPDGSIVNNLQHPDVTRAVEYMVEMGRSGILYPTDHPHGDWVSPQVFAYTSDKILFLGLEPEWTYIASTENLQNPAGVENDIFDTVSDFAFVPYPRDPQADKYYQASSCFGYMIPKGAKNTAGAVEFIMCNRLYETDENIKKQIRDDHIAPEKVTYTAGKYEGMQKWQMTWDPTLYDLWREMCDPDKFSFVIEDLYGFGSEMQKLICQTEIDCSFGEESWTQKVNEVAPLVQGLIDEYSD